MLLDLSDLSTEDLYNQITGPDYLWPAPSTTYKFTKRGTYYVAATMYGDYGLTYIGAAEITIN